MNEILIQSENQPELRFQGQLISANRFAVDIGEEESREFNLEVFAVEQGGFVAVLRYESSSQLEKEICWYEDMDQFKDVENFFYVFEASEVICGYDRMNRVDRENAALTCKRISAVYETSLFRFLDLVRHRAVEQKMGDRVIEKSTKPSILRSLGFKRD